METWQDIKDFFFPALQDTEAGQRFFTVDQAEQWANSALWEMGQYAQYYDLVETQTTTDGTRAYNYGTQYLKPYGLWRVEIDDEAIQPTTEDRVTRLDRSWESRTGEPKFYYIDNTHYADATHSRVNLWEEPDGEYELRTYCYSPPPQVSNSADTKKVQVPQWAIYGVIWYMLSEAYMAETRRQNFDTAAYYRMLFEGIIDRMRSRNFTRLDKRWVMGRSGHKFDVNFFGQLPDTIPEP